jgi:hypothetical protein
MMTEEEQLDHLIRNKGQCRRFGRYCKEEFCVAMADKACSNALSLYAYALEKKANYKCLSIWEGSDEESA